MYIDKLRDAANNVTTSQAGKQFNFESPVPGVHIYSDVWLNSMDFFSKIDGDEFWNNAGPGAVKWIREDYLDEDTGKKSTTCWLWNHEEIKNALGPVVDSYLYHWNLDPKSRESMRITKFTGPGEFFGSHSDDSFATPRTASMVYYPNDDYEGGELEFIHFGVTIKPKAGQLFMFPSGYSYEHKVHPVISGTRITMVSFFNEITPEERGHRVTLIDPNTYYQPKLQDVFAENFG